MGDSVKIVSRGFLRKSPPLRKGERFGRERALVLALRRRFQVASLTLSGWNETFQPHPKFFQMDQAAQMNTKA